MTDIVTRREQISIADEQERIDLYTETKKNTRLGQAKASVQIQKTLDIPFYDGGKNYLLGYVDPSNTRRRNYHDTIKIVRWFYGYDPIAGTVINRMADMSITVLRNRKKTKLNANPVPDDVLAYYNALVQELRPFFKAVALEYLLHGMALPEYTTKRIRGDLISDRLGRTRYITVDKIWLRNPENIVLKKRPMGAERLILFKVPPDQITFIQNKGKLPDGTTDVEGYKELVANFPDFVAAVLKGQILFPLVTMRPIYRKLLTYDDYPVPFLQNALTALEHKEYIKAMDRSIAKRVIEAIRHVKIGDKDFPADQDDIDATEAQVTQTTSTGDRIYNLFTNHTVTMEWVLPPFEALLNEAKYSEPNADIFLGLGFPRILTVGETAKSNAADNKIASIGPKATLEDLREAIIVWLRDLFRELAELNGFKQIPEPYFAPIATTDMTALIQFAVDALNAGAISRDAVAQLYNSDYETEADQINTEIEDGILSPVERATQQAQDFQVQQTEKTQQFQSDMADKNAANNKPAPNNTNK
jgi:hypothetical protein